MIAQSRRPTKHASIRSLRLDAIYPSPENDELYGVIDPATDGIQKLAESIRDHGIREPLVVTLDGYILSGHRRYTAAHLADLETVLSRVAPIRRADDIDQFVRLLRECNRQRVKSFEAQVWETIIDADQKECRAEMVAYRRAKSKVEHDRLLIGAAKSRKKISDAKSDFRDAILRVLNDRRDFWPLSDQQIHYALLYDPPLKHAGKPNSTYQNDLAPYRSLVDMLTQPRLDGTIPFAAIGDETRPFVAWNVYREPGAFVAKEIEGFLKGCFRDLMQSQPNHVEVVVEKNTVAGIVKNVCADFRIPLTSGRDYCSLPPRNDMAERFLRSGKEKLIVLLVSDFDPDGEAIAESFARSMRDDFAIDRIHPMKVALTGEQVCQHDLPTSLEATTTSSRAEGFIAKHGKNVWELEALPPATLQKIVRDAIVNVLDMDLFEQEQKAEADDAAKLYAVRLTVQEALKGIRLDAQGGDA